MDCQLNKHSLTDCYERVGRVGLSVEKNHERASRRMNNLNRGGSTNTTTNSNGKLFFKGKEVNEYGIFKDRTVYDTLTKEDKKLYYKQKDAWKWDNKIKDSSPTTNSDSKDNFKKLVVKKVCSELLDVIDTGDANASPSDASNDIMNKILKTLKSKVKFVQTYTSLSQAYMNSILQDSGANTILDSGADTTLLGSSFIMLGHTARLANVAGFDEGMVLQDLMIGTGVAAFDKADGTTVLVLVNEAIDYTTQPHSMLSTNQLHHHGVMSTPSLLLEDVKDCFGLKLAIIFSHSKWRMV